MGYAGIRTFPVSARSTHNVCTPALNREGALMLASERESELPSFLTSHPPYQITALAPRKQNNIE